MKLHEVKNFIETLSGQIKDSEELPVQLLLVKAQQIVDVFPHDVTTVSMLNFLKKKADKSLLITRQELKDVYGKLYSPNNKFAAAFSKELEIKDISPVKKFHRSPNEGKDLYKSANEKYGDPVLSNAISGIFEKNAQYKPYSAALAISAERVCLHELNRFIPPKKTEVVAGQSDLFICKASFETPKGITSALIPVEVKNNIPLIPTIFLSRVGFVDLSKETLTQHILDTAGKNFSIDVKQLLAKVAEIKNNPQPALSEVEMIVAKTKLGKFASTTTIPGGIFLKEIDKKEDKQSLTSESTEKFAQQLSGMRGVAEIKFGRSIVESGRNLLKHALNDFGYNQSHITVGNVSDDTIYFIISVDRQCGFKAPVKITRGHIDRPQFILSSGNIYPFSKQGISEIMIQEETDLQALASASPCHELSPAELTQEVESALAQDNLARAEDALTVLQNSNNHVAFKQAFELYKKALNGKTEIADETCCSKQRKVAYSKYMICGHTNLPVHKVYQDKYGQCQPLYRKHIAEPEGGSFVHSKVYFG